MITIHTRLDARIYARDGGGQDRIRYTWAVGPLNLLHAAEKLPEHRAGMVQGYGNIGCGGSWLQIGDQRIDDADLPETLTESRDLLQRVESGRYAADLRAMHASMAESDAAETERMTEQTAREMADLAVSQQQAEADERAAELATDASARAAWHAQQAAEQQQTAAQRLAIDQRQAQRDISRNTRRDWRRAGC